MPMTYMYEMNADILLHIATFMKSPFNVINCMKYSRSIAISNPYLYYRHADWSWISMYISASGVDVYPTCVNWDILSRRKWTDTVIDRYAENWNWRLLTHWNEYSAHLLSRHVTRLDWTWIKHTAPAGFIERHCKYVKQINRYNANYLSPNGDIICVKHNAKKRLRKIESRYCNINNNERTGQNRRIHRRNDQIC